MTKTDFTKQAVRIVLGLGTAKIVHDIIDNNVDTETTYDSVTVAVTSVAVGSMVSEQLGKFTDDKIEAITTAWKNRPAKKL